MTLSRKRPLPSHSWPDSDADVVTCQEPRCSATWDRRCIEAVKTCSEVVHRDGLCSCQRTIRMYLLRALDRPAERGAEGERCPRPT